MKDLNRPRRVMGVGLCLGIIIAICAVVAIRRAGAIIAVLRPAVIFTVSPGQTARLNVISPSQNDWSTGASRRMLLGFDVYRRTDLMPSQVDRTSCAKYHMVERQSCEVTLRPGEAASFDFSVPSDGVATQISPVFSIEGNDVVGAVRTGDLVPTIEFREGGKTTGLLVLPAVQQVDQPDDRR